MKTKITPPKILLLSILSMLLGGCITDPKSVIADTNTDQTQDSSTEMIQAEDIEKNIPAIERDIEKYEAVAEVVTRGASSQSIIEMKSSDVTPEFLDDWYKNYVGAGRCDAYIILYSDQENKGVFATGAMINVGSELERLSDGMIKESDTSESVTYLASDTEDIMTLEEYLEKQSKEEETGCAVSEEHCG